MTPLEEAPAGLAAGRRVYLKREDLHELGAFKWRGALPTLEQYRSRGATGVVTASTGNHGAATSWAARQLGLRAIVFAPEGSSRTKLDLIGRQSAEIRLVGRDLDEAKNAARIFAAGEGLPFFEDGDEAAQHGGYGDIGREILRQCPDRPGAVVVPVGNGALAAGIGLVLAEELPRIPLVAVAASEAPVMARSFQAHRPVPCDRMATFADGIAVRVAIPRAVAVLDRLVSRYALVSEREMALAVGAYAAAGIRCEGAAAAPLAAMPQIQEPDPIVLILTGRNIDEALWRRAVEHPESFPADRDP